MFLIVPDFVSDAINAALDKALDGQPEEAKQCRPHLYRQLLDYYNEHGTLPEFSIQKADKDSSRQSPQPQ